MRRYFGAIMGDFAGFLGLRTQLSCERSQFVACDEGIGKHKQGEELLAIFV